MAVSPITHPPSARTPVSAKRRVFSFRSAARLTEVVSTEDSTGGAAISPDLVAALVPENILHEDEIVLVLTRPSLFYILYSSFPTVFATFVLGLLAAQLTRVGSNDYFNPTTVALATVLLCVGRLIWALLVWSSHTYMLTNRRVVTIKGVVNVHMFQAQLRKIQKTDLYRPIGQRLFATGTVGFSTAAATDTGGAGGGIDSTWVMIARPVETYEQITAAINKAQPK